MVLVTAALATECQGSRGQQGAGRRVGVPQGLLGLLGQHSGPVRPGLQCHPWGPLPTCGPFSKVGSLVGGNSPRVTE